MNRKKSVAPILATLWLAFFVAGCSVSSIPPTVPPPTPTPVPPTETPLPEAGWTVYQMPEAGFTIALPPTWRRIDMDSQTFESILQIVSEQSPEMATLLEGQVRDLAASGFVFFGLDLSPESIAKGYISDINILKQDLQAKVSLDFYAQITVGMLENLDGVIKPVTHRRVQWTNGDAEELHYGMKMTVSPDKTVVMDITQYLVIAGKTSYVITLATTADQAEKYRPLFEKIGKSFRLIKE